MAVYIASSDSAMMSTLDGQSGENRLFSCADPVPFAISKSSTKELEGFISTWPCDVLRQSLLGAIVANALGLDSPGSAFAPAHNPIAPLCFSSLSDAAPPYHCVGHDVPPAYHVDQDNQDRCLDLVNKAHNSSAASNFLSPQSQSQPRLPPLRPPSYATVSLNWDTTSNIQTHKKKKPAKKSSSNATYRQSGRSDDNRDYGRSGYSNNFGSNNNGQSAGRAGLGGAGGSGDGRPPGEGGDPFRNRPWDVTGRKLRNKTREEEEEEEEEQAAAEAEEERGRGRDHHEREGAATRAREVVEFARRQRQPRISQAVGDHQEGWSYSRPTLQENMASNNFVESLPPRIKGDMRDNAQGAREALTLNTENLTYKTMMSNPPPFLDEDPHSGERYREHPSASDGQSIMGTNSAFGAFDFGGFGAERQSLSTGGPPSAYPRSEKSFPIGNEVIQTSDNMPDANKRRSPLPGPEFHSQRESPEIFRSPQSHTTLKDSQGVKKQKDSFPSTLAEQLKAQQADRGNTPRVLGAAAPDTNHWENNSQTGWRDDQPTGNFSFDEKNDPIEGRISHNDPRPGVQGNSLDSHAHNIHAGLNGKDTQPDNDAAEKSSSSEYEEPAGGLWGFFGATRKKKKDKTMTLDNLGSSPEESRKFSGDSTGKLPSMSSDDRDAPANAININRQPDENASSEKNSRHSAFSPDDHQLWMEAGRDDARSGSPARQLLPLGQIDADVPSTGVKYKLDRSKVHKYPAAHVGLQGLGNDLGQGKRRPSIYNPNQMLTEEVPPPPPTLPQTLKKGPDDPWANPWQSQHQLSIEKQVPGEDQQPKKNEIPPLPTTKVEDEQLLPINRAQARPMSKIRLRPSLVENPGSGRQKVARNSSVTPELTAPGIVNTTDRESFRTSGRTSTRSRGVLPSQWGTDLHEEDPMRPSILGEPLNMFNVPSLRPGTRVNGDQDPNERFRRGQSRASSRISPDVYAAEQRDSSRGGHDSSDYDWTAAEQEFDARPQSRIRAGTVRGATIARRHRPTVSLNASSEPRKEAPPIPAEPKFPLTNRKSIVRMNPDRERAASRSRRGEVSSAVPTRYLSRERPRNMSPQENEADQNSGHNRPQIKNEKRAVDIDINGRSIQRNANPGLQTVPLQPPRNPLTASSRPISRREDTTSSEKESSQSMEDEVPRFMLRNADRKLTSPPSTYGSSPGDFDLLRQMNNPPLGNAVSARFPRGPQDSRTMQRSPHLPTDTREEDSSSRNTSFLPERQLEQPTFEGAVLKRTRPESRQMPLQARKLQTPLEDSQRSNDAPDREENLDNLAQPPSSPIRQTSTRKPYQAEVAEDYCNTQPHKRWHHDLNPDKEHYGRENTRNTSSLNESHDQIRHHISPIGTNPPQRQRRRGSTVSPTRDSGRFSRSNERDDEHPSQSSPKTSSSYNRDNIASFPAATALQQDRHSSRQNIRPVPEQCTTSDENEPKEQFISPRYRNRYSEAQASNDYKGREASRPASPVAREPVGMVDEATQESGHQHQHRDQHTQPTSRRHKSNDPSKENLRRFRKQIEEKLKDRPDSERVRLLEKHLDERLRAESSSKSEDSSSNDEFISDGREEPEPTIDKPLTPAEQPKEEQKLPEDKPQASTGLIGSIWGLVKMGAGQQKPAEVPENPAEPENNVPNPEPDTPEDPAEDETHEAEQGLQGNPGVAGDEGKHPPSQSHGLPSTDRLSEEQTPISSKHRSRQNLQPTPHDEHDMKQVTESATTRARSEWKRHRSRDMHSAKKASMSRSRRDSRLAPAPVISQDQAQPVGETVAGDPHKPADTTASRKVRQHHNNPSSTTVRDDRQPEANRVKRHVQPEVQSPVSAQGEPAYSNNVSIEEERPRRSSSRPANLKSKSGEEGSRSQKARRKPTKHRSNTMNYYQAYIESEGSSPRRRSLSTWELSDTESEPEEEHATFHVPPPPPPPPESAAHEVKSSRAPSEVPSTARRLSVKKPPTKYNVHLEHEIPTNGEQPRPYTRTRILPRETQPIKRPKTPIEDDYESGQLSQNDSEDVSSPEEPEVAKPLINITPRTKSAKDRSNRPEPKGKHHRRSMPVKMPPLLVNDEVEQSSEEDQHYSRHREARRSEKSHLNRSISRRRERNREPVPESSPIEQPVYDRPLDRLPRERRPQRSHSQVQMQEPEILRHEPFEAGFNEPRPLHRSSTLPATRMPGILGSLWNNLRRQKPEEGEHAASDDNTRQQYEQKRDIPRRTQSHRHRRSISEIPSPTNKTDPEQERYFDRERDRDRDLLEAKAERRAKRRESRERHRLHLEAEERAADLKRIEAERTRQQEEDNARRSAEKRARKRALQAKRLEEEEISRQRVEEREARRAERSARKERRRTQEREESTVRSRSHRRRHSMAIPGDDTTAADQIADRQFPAAERSSQHKNHHSEDDAGHRKRQSHSRHRSHDVSDWHKRTPRSGYRKKIADTAASASRPTYPSAGHRGNEKTASWVKSQSTDPPEPPPVVPTVVDLPGGEGHTISSDEEVRKELRRQARRRKKYGDMTDEDIERYRTKRRIEREQARHPEGPGHVSDGIQGKMGKWLKKLSK